MVTKIIGFNMMADLGDRDNHDVGTFFYKTEEENIPKIIELFNESIAIEKEKNWRYDQDTIIARFEKALKKKKIPCEYCNEVQIEEVVY